MEVNEDLVRLDMARLRILTLLLPRPVAAQPKEQTKEDKIKKIQKHFQACLPCASSSSVTS